MTKRCFHFKSDIAFGLYINGEYVDKSIKQESLDLVVTSNSFCYMLCPIGGYLVENGMVYNQDKVTIEGGNVELVPYKENHYDILFMPQKIQNLSKSDTVLQIVQDNIGIVVYNNPYGIIDIEFRGQTKILKQLQSSIKLANIEKIQANYVVSCLMENEQRYIVVVDNSGIIFEQLCDDFELTDSEVKTITLLKDIASTAKVTTYNIFTNKTTSYTVIIEDRPIVKVRELIPMAMLQAVVAENYQLAKQYFSKNFEGIEASQLVNYFGNIDGIYYNRYLVNNEVNYTIKSDNVYRSFDFIIKDNKIEDIKEVLL